MFECSRLLVFVWFSIINRIEWKFYRKKKNNKINENKKLQK